MKSASVLQLKIMLMGSRPPIWRTLLIPADCNFFALHVAIQDAFGWMDSHLHQFHTADPYRQRGEYQRIGFPMPEMEDEDDMTDERKTKLSGFLRKPKDKIWYEYDFGDSWIHEIIVEKIMLPDSKTRYPNLIDGTNACPPEDCGGIGGYGHLLEVLADPKNEEYGGMLEWLGIESPADFDPEYFEKKDVKFRDPKKVLKQYEKGFGVE